MDGYKVSGLDIVLPLNIHICGEANDVDLTVMENWKQKLAELIQEFEPENAANCDETGLFFRALPN